MNRLPAYGACVVASVAVGTLIAFGNIELDGAVLLIPATVLAVPVVVGAARRKHDLFEPSYLFALAFAVLFLARPLLEWSSGHGVPTMGGLDPAPTYLLAILLASLGGLSFFAGYYSAIGTRIADRLPSAPTELNETRVRIGVVGLTTIGIALYVAFLLTTGGLESLRAVIAGRNPEFVSSVMQPAGYLYSGLLFLFPAGVILLATIAWRSPWGICGLLLVLLSLLPALFSGARSAVLPGVLTLLALWYLRRARRPRVATLVGVGLAAFILVITVPRDYRNTGDRTGSLIDAVTASATDVQSAGREFLLGLDTAMLPAFAIEISEVPGVVPYQWGATYLEAALRPIPRAIWSGKPESADTRLMSVLWPDLAAQGIGLAFSFFGEPFLNFGIPGVVAVGALFGVVWRCIWEYWRRHPQNAVAIGILAISWPFMIVYLRGGIGVDYQRHAIALVPFVAMAWFAAATPGIRVPPAGALVRNGPILPARGDV